MKQLPILFSGPMVRAILESKKTQTRRIVKHQRDMEFDVCDPDYGPYWLSYAADAEGEDARVRCPYGKPGDRLWVREGHALDGSQVFHRAGHAEAESSGPRVDIRWRPSIFMPRWASRITLEITGVRVERLQQISEADARAEGISELLMQDKPGAWWAADPTQPKLHGRSAIDAYRKLWEFIHGPVSWDANPWVWVVKFRIMTDPPAAAPLFRVMVVCLICGNKRCPHATDHRLPCTGSNEPGQPGSVYTTHSES